MQDPYHAPAADLNMDEVGMNLMESRGRVFVILFIVGMLAFDVLVKGWAWWVSSLRPTQIVGSLLTLLVCYFLWRGARAAHWFLVAATGLSFGYSLFLFLMTRTWPLALLTGFAALGFVAMIATSTRAFLAYQRWQRLPAARAMNVYPATQAGPVEHSPVDRNGRIEPR